jgi:hypothetical protein
MQVSPKNRFAQCAQEQDVTIVEESFCYFRWETLNLETLAENVLMTTL